MLTDLDVYIERNSKKWDIKDKKKMYHQLKRALRSIEKEINKGGFRDAS